MADLADLSTPAVAPALSCDRAIFTSIPSPTGEGYRLVAWSAGVRPEERQELTRRAPSHGALSGNADPQRGVVLMRLASTGRYVAGLVRVSGAEHTQRGGGRVWTDLLVADAFDAMRAGLHPQELRTALAGAEPPKKPLGSAPLARLEAAPCGSGAPLAASPRAVAIAAGIAALLYDGRPSVVAAGPAPLDVLEDALRMLPPAARGGIEAAGALRFSPVRGVKVTITDRIEQDTVRVTRGQGIESIDLATKTPPADGPLAPWLALMARWWNEGRGTEAVALCDRLGDGWDTGGILAVAGVAEAIDRGEEKPEALEALLSGRDAA